MGETLVKVDGKIYTQINITPESAIEVLVKDCELHGKSILKSDEDDEKSIEIFKALASLKKYYSSLIDDKTTLSVRSVFDSASLKFYVMSDDVLDALYSEFTQTPYNRIFQYGLLHSGIEAEQALTSLELLNKDYINFINSTEETLTKVRK